MPIQAVEPQRLYRRIAEQIARLIKRGEYKPGERLPPERDLATMLKVSRPSVREALIALEVEGYNVANKASTIQATYLEKAGAKKVKLLEEAMKRGEEAIDARPKDANAHYFYAMAAGRYSQEISVAKALAQGLGGRIKEALNQALKLQPKHADAHIALGAWHAEIIGKVGAMVGGLTYGAKKDAALDHFAKALKLNPDSAIARIEYANALAMLFGKERMQDAEKLYADAASQRPVDAMERLDVEAAKAALED